MERREVDPALPPLPFTGIKENNMTNTASIVILHENNVRFEIDGQFPFGNYKITPIIYKLNAVVGERGQVVFIGVHLSNGQRKLITHRGNFTIIR